MKILKLPLGLILAALVLLMNPAVAHNSMTVSLPADGAVLTHSPEFIELNFSDATWLEALELIDGNDETLALEFEKSLTASRYFSVTLPLLSNGDYRVKWLVIGNDTHEIRGEIGFRIDALVDAE